MLWYFPKWPIIHMRVCVCVCIYKRSHMQRESYKKLLLYGRSPLSDNYMKLSNLKSYGGHQNKTLCMTFVFITTYETTLFSYRVLLMCEPASHASHNASHASHASYSSVRAMRFMRARMRAMGVTVLT